MGTSNLFYSWEFEILASNHRQYCNRCHFFVLQSAVIYGICAPRPYHRVDLKKTHDSCRLKGAGSTCFPSVFLLLHFEVGFPFLLIWLSLIKWPKMDDSHAPSPSWPRSLSHFCWQVPHTLCYARVLGRGAQSTRFWDRFFSR